ncbi:MAG TPA: hypothetical protein VEB42_06905 [Chitinophagaceae bacterium]|nr:hypothetical protein [Chitinophagaceae bacterium]
MIGLAIAAVPVVFTVEMFVEAKRRKRKERQLGLAYQKLIMQNRLSVEHAEILDQKVLAMDRKSKKLLLIDHTRSPRQELCIPLTDIETTRVVEVRDRQEQYLQEIKLALRHKRSEKETIICFYDESRDDLSSMKMLYRKALHWKSRIDIHRHRGRVNMEMEYVL